MAKLAVVAASIAEVDMTWQVIETDCVEAMRDMDEASVDAVVTDPPYGLEFMGRKWDRLWDARGGTEDASPGYVHPVKGKAGDWRKAPTYQAGLAAQQWHQAWATEALRVLKPGGHLLAFGGSRTFHRLACAVEDAGFEIRDSIMHLGGGGATESSGLLGWVYGSGLSLPEIIERQQGPTILSVPSGRI